MNIDLLKLKSDFDDFEVECRAMGGGWVKKLSPVFKLVFWHEVTKTK